MLNTTELLAIPALPLIASLIVGLFGWALKEKLSHTITTGSVILSAVLSVHVFTQVLGGASFYGNFWTWMLSDTFVVPVGMMIDQLTAIMMITVTVVSACVHIYTIGYMHGDPGYSRFFSYISGFTFSMLVLVMGNNFFTLFFGWEAVGLVSYLLIGFWFNRESANFAALKAFIVNRVGDFGFLVGILAIWYYFGSFDYREVFAAVPAFVAQGDTLHLFSWEMSAITFICLSLFIGAMGKSGQVPLHVWLPDSMEGPTPISALIHAATMVTAGVFMVARCSPMFEYSETALAAVILVGAVTAWMCATIGLVQNDIKRVIAYSTCSQLGYMFVACGVSAYSVGIFHLMTHAYFKALLFLAAGSVIHAVMAEQDIRKMGQLRKYMPITYITMLIAALALSGVPPFAGFWSKDLIIESVGVRELGWIGDFAYFAVLSGVFMTAFYTFRMFFLTFHNSNRVPEKTRSHLHESPKVITIPLMILAVGAFASGAWGVLGLDIANPEIVNGYFGTSLFVLDVHNPLLAIAEEGHHAWYHFVFSAPFWLAIGGIGLAFAMYFRETDMPGKLATAAKPVYTFLLNKWYWDELYERILMRPAQCLGNILWQKGDLGMIDKGIIHGGVVGGVLAGMTRMRDAQTGYVYHYAFAMVIGVFGALTYLVLKG
ncbi:MAG: NADH-quinone oxidoreductase subunit L [Zetaproteobacteria bacterium CG12_big_fil_rev_8_21_14_0_65_55_1124]|nr:MAG: NADH-quinone oxidoreductase subunit L [Zetaproteobacteria bacterium CG1_02_55_237]PIS19287.1 MAG: NADH-quinone oxidoreductase subunit L [Zetaproteobacteria bacterium CG08_land_8_20_14_0_20_55_17]PIW43536.1 MAG: NADH-quinone oxidoreductase subunit L [Zetaproteobacteria bacterium CG12_big_fil_rev_8_21_14_0_65_55_1124]PIY54410.1 MAG: NADH-quinone oxidoreductase subunit L [Zetaproteobacteria bacterium CG_4_10_14_0_8_um_filter_55_43]PIZ38999.1 MAG: NADH-quinone oxidoreductase subunit L [Zeta